MVRGFAYAPPYTLTPGQPSPGRATFLRRPYGLPTTSLGRVRGRVIPKDRRLWLLSIARFGMGACKRVREPSSKFKWSTNDSILPGPKLSLWDMIDQDVLSMLEVKDLKQ
jgi:hypothetical protein